MQDDPKVRDILAQAAELAPAARPAFLDQACAGDSAVRAEVESLLIALDDAEEFLVSPTVPAGDSTTAVSDDIGSSIGPYKLIEKLGEGGMGVVYLAEQTEPLQRRVALKIIKPGMDTRAVIARFEGERQALAVMDHSNIARVLDVGSTSNGRPYFVMEHVRGVSVAKYCDQNRLTPDQRLQLFIPICQAVQHAHQKGIIHRDLKPSNILVMLQDDRPVVKVIDFGIARAIDQVRSEKTEFTQHGMIVGTPEYMSPEQAGGTPEQIDTRSDIYTLGVILYELLTGATPLDRQQLYRVGYEQMMRTIREAEPPRPSTRLSKLDDGVATASALRRMEPRNLMRLLLGDLDLIVMKCLEKDRNRRYESASALARDLERFLNHDPVEATPPTYLYVLGKYAWKYRRSLAVSASFLLVVGVLLITTTIIFWVLRNDAAHQRDLAVHAKVAAEQSARSEALAKDIARQRQTAAEQAQATAESESYVASVYAANSSLQSGDLYQTQNLLDHAPQRLRNWEWNYLHAASNKQLLTIFRPRALAMYYNQDFSAIVQLGDDLDHSIHFLDPENGTPIRPPLNLGSKTPMCISADQSRILARREDRSLVLLHGDGSFAADVAFKGSYLAWCLAFSPDGSRLALSGGVPAEHPTAQTPSKGALILINTTTGQVEHVVLGNVMEITSIRFSLDGSKVVSGSPEGTTIISNAATGQPICTYHNPEHSQMYCGFSPDGSRVVCTIDSPSRQGVIIDAQTGAEILSLTEGTHLSSKWWANYSSDGKLVLIAGGQVLSIYNARSGALTSELSGHGARILFAATNRDTTHVFTVADDLTARIWTLVPPSSPTKIPGENGLPIIRAAFVSGSSSIVATTSDGTSRIYDIPGGHLRPQPPAGTDPNYTHPSRYHFDSRQRDGSIGIFDANTGSLVSTLQGTASTDSPPVIAFTHDGHRVVTGSSDGTLSIWDIQSGKKLLSLPTHDSEDDAQPVQSLTLSSADDRLVVTRGHIYAELWDLSAKRFMCELQQQGAVASAAFSHDGKLILTYGADFFPRLWNANTGGKIDIVVVNHATITSAEFSPDDSQLLLSCSDENAEIWSPVTRKRMWVVHGHAASVLQAHFSPDLSRVITSSVDGTARIWDTTTGRELLALRGHNSPVVFTQFSPDGTKILTLTESGVVRIWDSVSAEQYTHPTSAAALTTASSYQSR